MNGPTALDLDTRWDPALVLRVVWIRMLSALSLAGAVVLLPQLGPNRMLIAGLLVGPVPAGNLVVRRLVDADRVLAVATVVDMVWCVVVAYLLPTTYPAAMLVAVAMLAFVAGEDSRALFYSAAIGTAGFTAVGLAENVDQWVVLVTVYVVLLPLLFFMSSTQRERELRYKLRLHHRAEHDSLTGLYNRAGLAAAMEAAPVDAVIAIDLDGFKDINDTLGHKAGDELLVALAERMEEAIGGRGVLARVGGDEFAVLVRNADPNFLAGELLKVCRHRIPLGDVDVSVGASIGVAFAETAVEPTELIRRADLAMYDAKRAQVGVRRWSGQTRSASRQRISLSGDVERGFDDGEFELFFQPIIDMTTEAVVDVEGLLRWRHPQHGVLGPADFLALVEGIGRRSTMDRLVFEQAAVLASRLQPFDIGVSVNVSAGSLLRSSVPLVLDDVLRRHDVVPQRITVEVIEDELVDDQSTARAVLSALGELGVGIAIDDFGTGHSSLSRLRQLPVTSVKIDRSFMANVLTSIDDEAIVAAVSHLGRALDLVVVAEGVEDMAVRDYLLRRELPVDRLQGFGIARPMPARDLMQWLDDRRLAPV
ncbi:MAG: bifunctional diguanylate cyclase/phosphodiesterase [Acidimicrobiales bacterium]|nr:bifunctional diguanylate cyclase/phosphodiesterase [Acidimicrobiales bacterium]